MKDVGELLTQFTSRYSALQFILLFVPGFVALAVYDQRIPSERRKFGEMGVSLVVYSLICDMFAFSFVAFSGFDPFVVKTPLWHEFFFVLVFALLIPAALGWFVVDLRQWLSEKGLALDPMPKAWDAFFARLAKSKAALVLVATLNDGRKVGGFWDKYGFTSTYPAEEDLFIGTPCQLNQSTGIVEASILGSQGMLLKRSDILLVEAFTYGPLDDPAVSSANEPQRMPVTRSRWVSLRTDESLGGEASESATSDEESEKSGE